MNDNSKTAAGRPRNDAKRTVAPSKNKAGDKPKISPRGVAPVVGMPCEPGYKLIGDDCVLCNPGFE